MAGGMEGIPDKKPLDKAVWKDCPDCHGKKVDSKGNRCGTCNGQGGAPSKY